MSASDTDFPWSPNVDYQYIIPFGPNGNCTLDICPLDWSVYKYQPSLGANIAFICLFAVAMVIHIILGVRWRTWGFLACMVVGCVDEIIGYVGRVMMHYNPFSFIAFMMQIVCITTGPVFFCAAIYVTLARTINHLDASLSRFHPKLLYWIFIPCDIVSLTLQATGGGMSTTSSGTSQTGVDIALAGLAFQVFTLAFFYVLCADYLVRYVRSLGSPGRRWVTFLAFMGLAAVLTLVRCAYRVDELSQGYNGPLIKDEGLFIALEGVFIVLATFSLCIGHPGLVFGRGGAKEGIGSSLEGGYAETGDAQRLEK